MVGKMTPNGGNRCAGTSYTTSSYLCENLVYKAFESELFENLIFFRGADHVPPPLAGGIFCLKILAGFWTSEKFPEKSENSGRGKSENFGRDFGWDLKFFFFSKSV